MAKALVGLALAAKFAAALNFPYVPTQILMPTTCYDQSNCSSSDVAYILSQTDNGVDFLQLDYSGKLDQNAKPKKVSGKLPFLDGKPDSTAFAAVRTATGELMVYAGECCEADGQMWTYSKDWKQVKTNGAELDIHRSPSFLGGALAFSATLAPETDAPTMYTYGGMCSTPGSQDDWQSSGNYTKTMLSISPDGSEAYDVEIASTAGPRSPFAGFSLTPLPPSMTDISGTVSQQASYVLLGGHTQHAFINISTAAVWNLPQQSWSYVDIAKPHHGGNTELMATKRDAGEVTSRSGHSAVLSEDGNRIIVLGGWVGDVHTPAEPQLAILEMGDSYDSWQWTVPDSQPEGNGMFGHGAAILPGNVMMVYGGWETDGEDSKRKRQTAASSSLRFWNLTSMSWVKSYDAADVPKKNPGSSDPPDAPDAPDASDSRSRKLGLGLGLGLGMGLVVIAGLVAAFCCLKSKKRRERNERDEAADAMTRDAAYFNEKAVMLERDHYSPFTSGWYGDYRQEGQQQQYHPLHRSPGYESMMSGAVPPPITRKPVNRPVFNNYSAYSPVETRMNAFISTPGQIHPIMEDDEDDHHCQSHHRHPDVLTPGSEINADPFADPASKEYPTILPPSRASATPSPERGTRRYDPDVQEWASDVDAADAMLARYNNRKGRTSPTRRLSLRSAMRDDDSRSGSNLSESARSQTDSLYRESRKAVSSSSDSFRTARSNRSGFNTLQTEGPSLLTGKQQHGVEDDEPPGSPSKSKPPRKGGWLGPIKRVFSGSGVPAPSQAVADGMPVVNENDDVNGHAGGGSSGDYEPLAGLGGEVLKRKQGRHGWEAGDDKEENDWDIEKAVEQRLVQVMFTVPREKLRVVNGADEEEDEPQYKGQEGLQKSKDSQVSAEQDQRQTQGEPQTQESFMHPRALVPGPLVPKPPEHRHTISTSKPFDIDSDGVSQLSGNPFSDEHSKRWSQVSDPDRDALLRMSRQGDLAEPRFSHSTTGSDPRVYMAEAVHMERAEKPKTRVLAMVDNLEKGD